MRNYCIVFVLVSLLFCSVVGSWAAAFSMPHTWEATDKAWRAWFNANFAACEAAHNAVVTDRITDLTILNADINGSAAIALTKLSESVIQADGGQAFTGSQSFGDFNITNLGSLALDSISADDATKGITIEIPDNLTIAAQFKQSTNEYLALVTTNSGELVRISQDCSIDGGTFTFNTSEADEDFRFAGSGETNLLFGDAGNGRVGIKTATPAYELEVTGDAYITGITYVGTTSTYFDTDGNHVLVDDNTIGISGGAEIEFDNQATDEILFNNCLVGIGTTGPTSFLHFYEDTASTTAQIYINNDGTGDASIAFGVTTLATTNYIMGVDNSDFDAFKIAAQSADLGTLTALEIATNRAVTVNDDLFVDDFCRVDALGVGSAVTDPGDNNIEVAGDAQIDGSINGDFNMVGTRDVATYTMDGSGDCVGGPMAQSGHLEVFVLASEASACTFTVYNNANNPADLEVGTVRWNVSSAGGGMVSTRVEKGHYFKVDRTAHTGTYQVHWIPDGADN